MESAQQLADALRQEYSSRLQSLEVKIADLALALSNDLVLQQLDHHETQVFRQERILEIVRQFVQKENEEQIAATLEKNAFLVAEIKEKVREQEQLLQLYEHAKLRGQRLAEQLEQERKSLPAALQQRDNEQSERLHELTVKFEEKRSTLQNELYRLGQENLRLEQQNRVLRQPRDKAAEEFRLEISRLKSGQKGAIEKQQIILDELRHIKDQKIELELMLQSQQSKARAELVEAKRSWLVAQQQLQRQLAGKVCLKCIRLEAEVEALRTEQSKTNCHSQELNALLSDATKEKERLRAELELRLTQKSSLSDLLIQREADILRLRQEKAQALARVAALPELQQQVHRQQRQRKQLEQKSTRDEAESTKLKQQVAAGRENQNRLAESIKKLMLKLLNLKKEVRMVKTQWVSQSETIVKQLFENNRFLYTKVDQTCREVLCRCEKGLQSLSQKNEEEGFEARLQLERLAREKHQLVQSRKESERSLQSQVASLKQNNAKLVQTLSQSEHRCERAEAALAKLKREAKSELKLSIQQVLSEQMQQIEALRNYYRTFAQELGSVVKLAAQNCEQLTQKQQEQANLAACLRRKNQSLSQDKEELARTVALVKMQHQEQECQLRALQQECDLKEDCIREIHKQMQIMRRQLYGKEKELAAYRTQLAEREREGICSMYSSRGTAQDQQLGERTHRLGELKTLIRRAYQEVGSMSCRDSRISQEPSLERVRVQNRYRE